jgi:chromosomal replication initiator protein DnaA
MNGVWQEFLDIVRAEVGSRVVETWFKAIVLDRWDSDQKTAYLIAPNKFVRDWVQNHYLSLIQLHLGRLLHVEMPRVQFIAPPSPEVLKEQVATVSVVPAERIPKNALISKDIWKQYGHINKVYSFDNFIVGPNNSLAYAAAQAVTERPGQQYNPLFIYGKSGLGKTHLMHAIGNTIKERYSQASVLYQTADRFVTEFISAIRFNKVYKFQEKYNGIDVLLIDDLQFISNKEHTQEAFFHIFNALYDSGKQIVFSSDTFPHDLKGIAERLRSRLASGLVTDIHVPSLETKMAILKKKAATNQEVLDNDVAHYIASQGSSNVRELEGGLIRVMAFASLTKQPITLDLAHKVLGKNQQEYTHETIIDFDAIVKCFSKYYPYTLNDLRSKHRSKQLSDARQAAMYLMKKMTDKSLRDIGSYLGGRDHSTVMYGLQKVEHSMKDHPGLAAKMQKIEEEISRL